MTSLQRLFFSFLVSVEVVRSYPRLNFLSASVGSSPMTGIAAMQPAFNYSLDVMSASYPKIFENYTYTAVAGLFSGNPCGLEGPENSMNTMSNLYKKGLLQTDGLTIFLAPLCGPSFTVVGDFGRELDFLSILCTIADSTVTNRVRFPATLSFAQVQTSPYGEALLALMTQYSWRTIAIISDRLSGIQPTGRGTEICRAPLEQLRVQASQFQFLEISVDSVFENFTDGLQKARNFSRIVLGCTFGQPFRHLLAEAADLGMTDGSYVFLYTYQLESTIESPFWWSGQDTLDKKVHQAFESVLVIRPPPVDWDKAANFTNEVEHRRKEMFGRSVLSIRKNEFVFAGFEAISALVQVLEDLCQDNDHRCTSGRFVAEKMLNRTYLLPFRSVTLTPGGSRLIEVIIHQYDLTSDSFKEIFVYNSFTKKLTARNRPHWISGPASPPDRPMCGLTNELCHDGSNYISVILCVVIATGVILLVPSVWLFARRFSRNLSDSWWKLPEGNLIQDHS